MHAFKLTFASLMLALLLSGVARAAPTDVTLAKDGKALLSIVIAPHIENDINAGASIRRPATAEEALLQAKSRDGETIRTAAYQLAEKLKAITGAPFEVKAGDGTDGIIVGTADSFPLLKLEGNFSGNDPTRREEYLLRTTSGKVLLVGATATAAQDAVWDFLYRLGYRQFFPGAAWEVIPKSSELTINFDEKQKPDYLSRRIWFTYGTWPENNQRMSEWNIKNRAVAGVGLNSGHAYDGIIHRHQAEFKAHPEYLTQPGGNKFCVSNPGLRQLVIDDALKYFSDNPTSDSYSVDPSDGGGWESSSCPDAQQIGSVSNRVVTLANAVAEAVEKKFPGKNIGFYAYNDHSPPPTIRVHPNAVVSIATAFIKGGFTVDQLIEGWQKQGATLGIREYFSIIHWDKDLPRGARAASPQYMVRTIPHFYKSGARFMSAESSDNWGPNGLGYYLASRLMWDIGEAEKIPELVEDFLDKSFGPAKEPMREYYGLINGVGDAPARPLSADFVGRMYRALQAAYGKTDDGAIRARLDDLALYTRYVELYLEYSSIKGKERQVPYEELIKFAWRIRDTHMLHTLAIYRTGLRDKSVKIPDEASWKIPEKDKAGQPLNPWKQSVPFTPQEVQTLVAQGVESNKLLDFEPRSYSADLVPARDLNLGAVPRMDFRNMRGVQNYYIWMTQPGTLHLQGKAGFQYQNRGNTKVQFFRVEAEDAAADDTGDEQEVPIGPVALTEVEIPPDLQPHNFQFAVPSAGLYRVQVRDGMMGSILQFPEGAPVVVKSELGATTAFISRWNLYFYVPKGTRMVGGFAYGGGKIHDNSGKVIFTFPAKNSYFSIPVPPGQDGKLWMFESIGGQIGLMTVPPYLARSEKELVLPKEVVEADRGK